jgi:hypothetical protein
MPADAGHIPLVVLFLTFAIIAAGIGIVTFVLTIIY